MKGLILKDIYSIRGQLVMAMLIMLLPNAVMWLMGGGMSIDSQSGAAIIVYGLMNYISIVIFTSFSLNTLSYDINSGWVKMERTCPVSGGSIIMGKLIVTLIVIGVITAVSLLFNLISVPLFGMDTEFMITIPLCCACLQVIALSPSFPLAMKIGAGYTEAIYLGLEIILACGLAAFAFAAFGGNMPAALIRVLVYAGLPVLAAVAFVLSYQTGKKQCLADI